MNRVQAVKPYVPKPAGGLTFIRTRNGWRNQASR